MPTSPTVRSGRRTWTIIIVVLLVLALGGALLFGRGAVSGGGDVLKVGDQRGGSQALLRAAGELDDVPYRIEWSLFPAAAPLVEALGAGAVDTGGVGGAPFAFAYAGGTPIKAIHAFRANGGSHSPAIVVTGASPIRSVADLKGRRIATVRGSTGQDTAFHLLERAGLAAGDVTWVYLANGDAKAALGAGSVDAWATWGSYVGIAVLQDKDRILADASVFPGSDSFYVATNTAIATKRAMLSDYVARLARARRWAGGHPREYAQVLARETGIPLNIAQFSVSAYLGRAVPIDDSVVQGQRVIFERYRKAGMIDKVPDLAGAYDRSFNDAIVQAAK